MEALQKCEILRRVFVPPYNAWRNNLSNAGRIGALVLHTTSSLPPIYTEWES